MEATWRCPKCGPISNALHGSDELFHCFECDAVVAILSDEERERSPSFNTWRTCRTMSKKKAKSAAKARTGTCLGCNQTKWLLSKTAEGRGYCRGCHTARKEGTNGGKPKPKKKRRKVRPSTWPKPADHPDPASLLRQEFQVLERVLLSLDELEFESRRRVLAYALSVFETELRPAGLLPGPAGE